MVFTKCEKALSGTALLVDELVLPADVDPLLEDALLLADESALRGGVSEFAEGV